MSRWWYALTFINLHQSNSYDEAQSHQLPHSEDILDTRGQTHTEAVHPCQKHYKYSGQHTQRVTASCNLYILYILYFTYYSSMTIFFSVNVWSVDEFMILMSLIRNVCGRFECQVFFPAGACPVMPRHVRGNVIAGPLGWTGVRPVRWWLLMWIYWSLGMWECWGKEERNCNSVNLSITVTATLRFLHVPPSEKKKTFPVGPNRQIASCWNRTKTEGDEQVHEKMERLSLFRILLSPNKTE